MTVPTGPVKIVTAPEGAPKPQPMSTERRSNWDPASNAKGQPSWALMDSGKSGGEADIAERLADLMLTVFQ